MAKVPGFLTWSPALSPALLPSCKSPGTDRHGSVALLKIGQRFAVIWLEGSMETKSKHHIAGSLSYLRAWGGGDVQRLLLYLANLPGSQ